MEIVAIESTSMKGALHAGQKAATSDKVFLHAVSLGLGQDSKIYHLGYRGRSWNRTKTLSIGLQRLFAQLDQKLKMSKA